MSDNLENYGFKMPKNKDICKIKALSQKIITEKESHMFATRNNGISQLNKTFSRLTRLLRITSRNVFTASNNDLKNHPQKKTLPKLQTQTDDWYKRGIYLKNRVPHCQPRSTGDLNFINHFQTHELPRSTSQNAFTASYPRKEPKINRRSQLHMSFSDWWIATQHLQATLQ